MVNGLNPEVSVICLEWSSGWRYSLERLFLVTDVSITWAVTSHLQSQVKSFNRMMVFMPLVFVWIGQFCRHVIWRQNVKVVVFARLLFCCYFQSVYCLFVSFVWGHVWVVCKVQIAVDIGSEVLVLSLCTSFLMSVIVGSLCCKWRIQQSPNRFCV